MSVAVGEAGGLRDAEARLAAEAEREAERCFKAGCDALAREYFACQDAAEAAAALQERLGVAEAARPQVCAVLGAEEPPLARHFVKRLVALALDRRAHERELAARLVASLAADGTLVAGAVAHGYSALLEDAAELALDVPDAPQQLALFLARAKLDGALDAPFFASARAAFAHGSPAHSAVAAATAMLDSAGGPKRVLAAWGGGAARTVASAKAAMDALLSEFFSSGDAAEAAQCLHALDMSFYHHEFVKRAVTQALEYPGRDTFMLELLQRLADSGALSEGQLAAGFARVVERIQDLALDVPDAPSRLALLTADARSRGLLPVEQSSWSMLRSSWGRGGSLKLHLGSDTCLDMLANSPPPRRSSEMPRGRAANATWTGLRAQEGARVQARQARASAPDLSKLSGAGSGSMRPEARARNYRSFDADYELSDAVGTGGYAVVRRCTHRRTGEECAVKLMKVSEVSTDKELTHEEIMNELALMAQIDHPNIVRIKEYFINDDVCYIVMSLLRGPELMDALDVLSLGKYTETDVRTIVQRLLEAVAYMHELGIVHRDLKLENLVLARQGDLSSVTVVDFGLAKAVRAREKMVETCGTTWYCAPELLMGIPYTKAVDLWSVGVIMYTLLSGTWPFEHEDEDELADLIVEAFVDLTQPEFKGVSGPAKDLLLALLEAHSERRITATEALEHSWFTGTPGHDAATLHHVHQRLDRLRATSRQLPVRAFAADEYLVRPGVRSRRACYQIVEGECALLVVGAPDAEPQTYERVGTLRKGNFVGDLRPVEDREPGQLLAVRAVTPVRAVVLNNTDMQWAVDFDYRLEGEFESALRARRKKLVREERELRKQMSAPARYS